MDEQQIQEATLYLERIAFRIDRLAEILDAQNARGRAAIEEMQTLRESMEKTTHALRKLSGTQE